MLVLQGHHLRRCTVLALLLSAATGCSPDPGTPEYVIAKLKQGHLVGGKNLDLLGPEQAAELQKLLDDQGAQRLTRLQALDRLCELQGEGDPAGLARYLSDPDPEVRMRVIRWLSERPAAESAMPLVQRFETEDEELVRAVLIQTLQDVGKRGDARLDEAVDRLAAGLAAAEGARRVEWIQVLGGWNGERVERLLIAALADEDSQVARAAARSLQGPAPRPVERVGPIWVSLLAHEQAGIRRIGLSALQAATHPLRVPGTDECAEKPVLKLLQAVPELPQAMEDMLRDADPNSEDHKLAGRLRDCLARFAPGPAYEGT